MWWVWLFAVGLLIITAIVGQVWRSKTLASQVKYEQAREKRYAIEDHINTIFVSLWCRPGQEEECARTMFNLFNEADNPHRITLGVLHHADDSHLSEEEHASPAMINNVLWRYEQICLRRRAKSFGVNVRVLVRRASDMSTAAAARAETHRELFRHERFWLMIDTSVRFVRGWDHLLVDMHKNSKRFWARPILTAMPNTHTTTPTFSVVTKSGIGALEFAGRVPSRCFITPVWTPAFSFSSSELLDAVPTDPHYADAMADAVAHGMRYATSGWTLLTPNAKVCWYESVPETVVDPGSYQRLLALVRRDRCRVCDTPRNEHTAQHGMGHMFEDADTTAALVHTTAGLGRQVPLANIETTSGIRVGDDECPIQPHTKLGCCLDPSEQEQIAKFGGTRVYRDLVSHAEQ